MFEYSGHFPSTTRLEETLRGEEAEGEEGEICKVLDCWMLFVLGGLMAPFSADPSLAFTADTSLCSTSPPSMVVTIVGSVLSADIIQKWWRKKEKIKLCYIDDNKVISVLDLYTQLFLLRRRSRSMPRACRSMNDVGRQ